MIGLKIDDMVLLDLDGNKIDSKLNPSSDTRTHLELYRRFDDIGGVVHTHSRFATAWAQARLSIPCLGTTHADYFYGDVPCTDVVSNKQISTDYERETGTLIIKTIKKKKIDYRAMRGLSCCLPWTVYLGDQCCRSC